MRDFSFVPGESFNGAVARWADKVGGVERMIELTRVAGVQHGFMQRAAFANKQDICALAKEMEVDPAELLKRATPYAAGDWTNHRHPVTFSGVVVPSLMIEKDVRRFSPSALAESPHHRASWDIRLLPVCTETGEILLDSCGSAECTKVGWSATLGIDRCDYCMTDLTRKTTSRVPEEIRVTLADFANLFSHDRSVQAASLALLPTEVAKLGAGDILDLIVRIVPVVNRELPTDLASLLKAPPLALSAAVAASWNVLVGWPKAMGIVANSHIVARVGRHNDGNGGRTMRLLTPSRHTGASDAVLNLIADWRRSISVDREEGAAMRERTFSGTLVSKTIGVSSNDLAKHRRAGLFQTSFALDGERPEARYERIEIHGIAAAVADRCSVSAARFKLGTSCHGVEQLVAMRLLEVNEHPFVVAHCGAGQISLASLDALLAAIRTVSMGFVIDEDAITLHSAMKAIGGRVKPWGPVFAILASGELPFALAEGDLAISDAIMIKSSTVPLLRSMHLPRRIAAILSPLIEQPPPGGPG